VYLTHCYAHTSAHVNFLPDSLKGADMSLWNTAQALGLKTKVVPTMSADWGYYDEDATHQYQSKFSVFNGQGFSGHEESWGHGVPESKVKWLNYTKDTSTRKPKAKAEAEDENDSKPKPKMFKEVQCAYMTVSPQHPLPMLPIQATASNTLSVWQ
jgi:hypothetical protein